MNLATREGMAALVQRAKLQNIKNRSADLDDIRSMLNGSYEPPNGWIAPEFVPTSARADAWRRALRTVTPIAPLVIQKSLAGLDFGATTWSEPEGRIDEVAEALDLLDLPSLARNAAIEYRTTGALSLMASTPKGDDEGEGTEPSLAIMRGVNVPYTDPRDQATITGWYRAIEYALGDGKLAWWVEVYDFHRGDEANVTHRIWKRLEDPTNLGAAPDEEFESTARPRYALYDLQPDGLPVSPVIANMGRIMGLYATELRLAAAEEVSAFPILVIKGGVDFDRVGPGEVIASDPDGDAVWLDPGNLEELREQVRMKRDQAREAFSLPGGSLGAQTPSGEALSEANRGFMQESARTSDAISRALTDAVGDYLELLGLPTVQVTVPIDRAYTTDTLLDVVEKGIDLGALPKTIAARMFQVFLGDGSYSDEELNEYVEILKERTMGVPTGGLFQADRPATSEPDDE